MAKARGHPLLGATQQQQLRSAAKFLRTVSSMSFPLARAGPMFVVFTKEEGSRETMFAPLWPW
eukprot:scaffold208306_cov53-Prasinocladus_malaysianus.AAC.1